MADFNCDGKLDAAVANFFANTVSVLLGNGDATFAPAVNYPAGTSPDFVAAFDFNTDGKLDLVVADRSTGSNIAVLLGNGDGTFRSALFYQAGSGPNSIAVADYNKGGKLDLAVANSSESDLSFGQGGRQFSIGRKLSGCRCPMAHLHCRFRRRRQSRSRNGKLRR